MEILDYVNKYAGKYKIEDLFNNKICTYIRNEEDFTIAKNMLVKYCREHSIKLDADIEYSNIEEDIGRYHVVCINVETPCFGSKYKSMICYCTVSYYTDREYKLIDIKDIAL